MSSPYLPDLQDSPGLLDPLDPPGRISRRDFLFAALLAPAAFAFQGDARFISTVPLGTPGVTAPPFGRLLGAGLDARLFTDLSTLGDQSTIQSAIRNPQSAMLTAADRFFVRTAAPPLLPPADRWSLSLGGLVETPASVPLHDLEARVGPAQRVLIECSGNADQSNYGLMSTADWEGVPPIALLDRVKPTASSFRILVSGVDDMVTPSRTSASGASWIFTRDELQRALLAVRMNGAALTRDHGFPVRLVVPGWYGCTCIKWVDRIDLVADEAPATTQMQEFAARTHQPFDSREIASSLRAGNLLRARDFIPAAIDTAAMPVGVEKWLIGGRLAYRITGIIWGGSTPTNALAIRFKSNQAWAPVDNCAIPASTLTWSLWSHTWRPDAPGRYQIALKVNDPKIRTRRLDIFFYVREVVIDEV
jgi:DMSO/TMAO reductase YedYZ molybdopterin-dependent catalytic subunit